jgi:hypothetical protein
VAPRSLEQRIADTKRLLEEGEDCWVATAAPDGNPHLVPLSFIWTDGALTLATSSASLTARNVAATGLRIGLGDTRDVVMIDGEVTIEPVGEDPARTEAFVAALGWDPAADGEAVFMIVRPTRIQAWREVDELVERTLMRGGEWLK